jgi:hypothetical protein
MDYSFQNSFGEKWMCGRIVCSEQKRWQAVMSDESLERYKTSRHEAIHALAALAFGHGVAGIDVDAGETLLEWSCHTYEIAHLLRHDSARAVHLITGVIASCIAPAADEHGPVNAGDEQVVTHWRDCWTTSAPPWRTIYCDARTRVGAWLREPQTQIHIARLTQALYVHRYLDGERLQRLLRQITTPAAPVQASPLGRPPTPAPQRNSQDTHNHQRSVSANRTRDYNAIRPQFYGAVIAR